MLGLEKGFSVVAQERHVFQTEKEGVERIYGREPSSQNVNCLLFTDFVKCHASPVVFVLIEVRRQKVLLI